MNHFRIELFEWTVIFDRGYGCDKRTGWSVAVRGSYVIQFEPGLCSALWKAWRRQRAFERD